jgi:hypothetical protein
MIRDVAVMAATPSAPMGTGEKETPVGGREREGERGESREQRLRLRTEAGTKRRRR